MLLDLIVAAMYAGLLQKISYGIRVLTGSVDVQFTCILIH